MAAAAAWAAAAAARGQVLLTLHFPTLRIMWMRSPHWTAEMFDMLKQNQAISLSHTHTCCLLLSLPSPLSAEMLDMLKQNQAPRPPAHPPTLRPRAEPAPPPPVAFTTSVCLVSAPGQQDPPPTPTPPCLSLPSRTHP